MEESGQAFNDFIVKETHLKGIFHFEVLLAKVIIRMIIIIKINKNRHKINNNNSKQNKCFFSPKGIE